MEQAYRAKIASWRETVPAADAKKAWKRKRGNMSDPQTTIFDRQACLQPLCVCQVRIYYPAECRPQQIVKSGKYCMINRRRAPEQVMNLGTLNEARRRMRASCEPTMLNLSTALDRSLQRSDQVLSSVGPGKRGSRAELSPLAKQR